MPAVQLTYVEEVTRGTTPSTPSMKELRGSVKNINGTKNELVSDEIRADLLQSDARHGFNQVGGTWSSPLALTDYDDIIRLAFQAGASWPAEIDVTGVDLSTTGATNTFTRASGNFNTDGFRPGDVITTAGFTNAGNNGQWTILTIPTNTTLTVYDPDDDVVDEAPTAGRTITMTGRRIDVGTTLTTLSVERGFTDITQYQVFRGVGFPNLSVSATPDDLVRISADFLGMSFSAASGTSLDGTPDLASNATAFGPFDGLCFENGTFFGVVTSINFSLGTRLSLSPVLFSKISPDIYNGTRELTGTITVIFEDATFYNQFVNETEVSLFLKFQDLNGVDFHNLVLSRVKINAANIDPPQEGPIVITSDFRALRDQTYGTPISWQKSNDTA